MGDLERDREGVLNDRYQHKPWWVRLWRRRWQLLVPYWALRAYHRDPGFYDYSFSNAWGHALGEADLKMQWWWTLEEMEEL